MTTRLTATVLCLAVTAALTGCATTPITESLPDVLRGYDGPEQPSAALARVELGMAEWASLSGPGRALPAPIEIGFRERNEGRYGATEVVPGIHEITWGRDFAVSFLVDPRMHAAYETRVEVALEAGRTYRLQMDRTYGPGYRVFSWIEDPATGERIYPPGESR